MNGMPSGEASPVFVGRDAELALLERALDVASSGTAGTVLIGAESGAGKSRLISEFAAKARDRALVLIGGCVEVSAAALPYAPITALLRKLVRSRGAGEVAALLPGNQAAELAVLLPEFGEQPSGGDPAMMRARLFCQYDPVTQVLDKNHVRIGADGIILSPISLRQAYPAEFDLMARIAGLRLRDRWGGWNGELYTASSWRRVSVYERAG
jgi:hypothetical protein